MAAIQQEQVHFNQFNDNQFNNNVNMNAFVNENDNQNDNQNDNDIDIEEYTYLTPEQAITQVPMLSRYQFWRVFSRELLFNEPIINLFQGDLEDREHFHYKFEQYYLRYLACCGQVNSILTRLRDIQNGGMFPTEEMFKQFLNDTRYHEFNGETLVFSIVQWNNLSAANILSELVNMGCDLTITNAHGMFLEETIHNGLWVSPFHRTMNIGHFNAQFMPIHFNVVRNANSILRRHRGHFVEIIHRIQEIVGEIINEEDQHLQYINQVNEHLRNVQVIG